MNNEIKPQDEPDEEFMNALVSGDTAYSELNKTQIEERTHRAVRVSQRQHGLSQVLSMFIGSIWVIFASLGLKFLKKNRL